jgi:hypothetical protein
MMRGFGSYLAKMTTDPYMKPVNLSTNSSKDLEDTLFLENWIEFVEEWNSEEQEGESTE